eukprot:10773574-Lingulodinium_polyedra.AAC.1
MVSLAPPLLLLLFPRPGRAFRGPVSFRATPAPAVRGHRPLPGMAPAQSALSTRAAPRAPRHA